MIDLSVVQSSVQTFIHNAILFINTYNNAWYNQVNCLIGMPFVSIIASNTKYNYFGKDLYILFTLLIFYFKIFTTKYGNIHYVRSDKPRQIWIFEKIE